MSAYYIRQRLIKQATANKGSVHKCLFGVLFVLLAAFSGGACAQAVPAEDTMLVAPGVDTFILKKANYHIIAEHYPELMYVEFPVTPHLLYAVRDGGDDLLFESEAGYDYYCEVYAFFLKQRNGAGQNVPVRDTLMRLFSNLNKLFAGLKCGGNYYAHMERRIAAYAEYGVYLYVLNDAGKSNKFPVTAQKKHYIALLRQIVADEMIVDDMAGCDAGRKRELMKLIDETDRLIGSKFCLEQALTFQTGLSAGDL